MKSYEGTCECPVHGKFEWFIHVLDPGEVFVGKKDENVRKYGRGIIQLKCPDCTRRFEVKAEGHRVR